MLAIYKRELRSFFHGMMGYLLTAFLLAASGIYFLALNLGYGLTDFGYYTLYRTIFMLLLYFPVLAMRSLAEEGEHQRFLRLEHLEAREGDNARNVADRKSVV